MKKMLLVTALMFVTMIGSGLAKGPGSGLGGHPPPIPPGKWWMMPEVADKLKLTRDEKKRLNDAFYQHREKMIPLRSALSKEHLDMEKLLDAEPFDAAASKAQFTNLGQARSALSAERFDFLIQVRQLLGLDRFQQLKWHFKQFKFKTERSKPKI